MSDEHPNRNRPAEISVRKPGDNVEETKFPYDDVYGEATLFLNHTTGKNWLEYTFEHEAFTGSKSWFLCEVDPDDVATITEKTARHYMTSRPVYYRYSWPGFFPTSGKMYFTALGYLD